MIEPPDRDARQRACDVRESFIVQAPAGSGKTTLLTERLLALLATAEVPEEVLAITFTRKAAAEMRERVLKALHDAEADVPVASHWQRQRELAHAVLARSKQKGWNLVSHPARLNIRTIDGFCNTLAARMPLTAKLGDRVNIVDDATGFYRDAARRLLAELEEDKPWSPAIRTMIVHIENDLPKVESLLVEMLKRRDQWMRHAIRHRGEEAVQARAALEAAVDDALCRDLAALRAALPDELANIVVRLVRYAGDNLASQDASSPICACASLEGLPGTGSETLAVWKGISALLLTNDGEVRKAVTVKQGFPAGKKNSDADNRKLEMVTLLDALQVQNEFIRLLRSVASLPTPRYDDRQWQVLEALLELLWVAVGHLRVVFAERASVDYAQITESALVALGTDAEPTDLLLSLDYRIRHVLVDEFQDVSLTQFVLLQRLTSGWENGDGRTFFAVGDPMQSIYRFREAEVGVFLRTRRDGIGALQLKPLQLVANFRSQAGIVEWVNSAFRAIFPANENVGAGAVTYAGSAATIAREPGDAVTVTPMLARDDVAEAERVVSIVREERAARPDASIAILVQSRGSLREIAPRLRAAGCYFQAVDVEALGHRAVVQDLLALTRALSHHADRIAWLAVLRAPWCGLTLADLHVLCGDTADALMIDLLHDAAHLERLSPDGRRRVARVVAVLDRANALRGRVPLRRRVEACWLSLGGAACVQAESDLTDADRFFELLEQHDEGGELASLKVLLEAVQDLRASPGTDSDARLQILTIHKAKGLEFDVVIIPGLGRATRGNSRQLLVWSERPTETGNELLLAPIEPIAPGAARHGSLYAYVEKLEKERQDNEVRRLLYVAATRAKSRLHLIGHTKVSVKDGDARLSEPNARSLLATLWPVVEPEYAAAWNSRNRQAIAGSPPEPVVSSRAIERLPSAWRSPFSTTAKPEAEPDQTTNAPPESAQIEFLWAGPTARHIGTVVHRFLMRMTTDGHENWNAARISALAPHYRIALQRLGVPRAGIEDATQRVTAALTETLNDTRGRWLLATHTDGHAEYALTGLIAGRIVNAVIDRTFVADGVRWIVDYKTGTHTGGDTDAFLDQECERYRGQLETYATLMRALDPRPIRLGLYFPLLRGWREFAVGLKPA